MSNTSSNIELISDLKNKINQFKYNFSKIKNNNKNNNLNFEINRDTLKLFYRKKNQDKNEIQNIINIQNLNKKENNTNEFDIKLKEKNEKKEDDLKINNKECPEIIKKSENNIINNLYQLYDDSFNKNNIKNNYSIINNNKDYPVNTLINEKNNFNNLNKIKENNYNNLRGNILLNNSKFHDINIKEIMYNNKLKKKEKSAPRISINHDYYLETPLTDKKRENRLNNNNIKNYSNYTLNNFYTHRCAKTNHNKNNDNEEKLQKLLIDFNIDLDGKINIKRKIPYLNLNSSNNNYKDYKGSSINKLFNYKNNFKNVNSLFQITRNINNNKIDSYLKNITNFDLYSKKKMII